MLGAVSRCFDAAPFSSIIKQYWVALFMLNGINPQD